MKKDDEKKKQENKYNIKVIYSKTEEKIVISNNIKSVKSVFKKTFFSIDKFSKEVYHKI